MCIRDSLCTESARALAHRLGRRGHVRGSGRMTRRSMKKAREEAASESDMHTTTNEARAS
eukprot:4930361-Pleurochrysis_carterae.AAC.1